MAVLFDAVAVHAYWSTAGLTRWNALRWRLFPDPGVPRFVTECGRDQVRDGPDGALIPPPGRDGYGWERQDVDGDAYLRELADYDAELRADGVYGVVFTTSPDDEWRRKGFSVDDLADRCHGLTNLGPHDLEGRSPQALGWAAVAPIVKSCDQTAAIRRARADAITVYRRRFTPAQQTALLDEVRAGRVAGAAGSLAGAILAGLDGFRHPNLHVELLNEVGRDRRDDYRRLARETAPLLRAGGVKVAGPSWATGDYEEIDWRALAAGEATTDELRTLARGIAHRHRLDWPVTERQVAVESSWNPRAVSASGAKGLMQLMDATARELGVADPFDPAQNLDGGMRYMRVLLDKYGGSYTKALVAYNWGPGNLDRLFASRPVDWRAGVSAQARRYLAKIQPPEDAMAAGNDGPRARTIGSVVHATRSGVERSLEDEADKTAAWMQQGAPNPSCHKVISPTRALEVVPKPLAAWHARNPLNGTHLGYELAQPFPTTPYHPGQYKLLARELVEDARIYGFPLVHVTSGNTTPGIVGHEETANGRADGKSDPGALFDWALLMREITALVKKPFSIAAERDLVWAMATNLEANGYPWYGQGLKALTAKDKGEK